MSIRGEMTQPANFLDQFIGKRLGNGAVMTRFAYQPLREYADHSG
jgi:hypothetical protein